MFDQCAHGKHKECIKEFRKFEIQNRRGKNTFVWLDDFVKCSCTCHRKKEKK